MRWFTGIILIALAFTFVLPQHIKVMPEKDDRKAIITLDICHSAAPALSAHGDMPCMNEGADGHLPYLLVVFANQFNPLLTDLLLADGEEHPPQS